MTFLTVEDQIIFHEGEKLKPYKCGADKLSIGIGRNLDDNGISKDESRLMFKNDMAAVRADLIRVFGDTWESFTEGRKRAFIDLRFNLGPNRFRGFNRLIRAAKNEQWDMAAYELTDSLWWRQVQSDRRNLLYHQLKTGEI